MALTVIFLLSLALFSMFALHQKKHTEAAVQDILEHYSIEQIYNEYQRHNRALWGFFVAGIALTGGFAITYFSGKDLDLATWKLEHYLFALVGLAVTLTITNGQRLLYQNISTHGIAFAVTLVILVFIYVSEISTQGERSELIMKERSKSSPTLSATLDAIKQQAGQAQISPYASQIAEAERLANEHRSKLQECETKYRTESRKVHCREYERAKMSGYEQQALSYQRQSHNSQQQNAGTLATLINEGKQLETNEDNYQAFIKFTKSFYGVSALSALTFIGFILVNAFEVLFHFVGIRTGILREALLRSGYQLEPKPPTREDINAYLDYKREKRRLRFQRKRQKYLSKLAALDNGISPLPLSNDKQNPPNKGVPEKRTDEKKRKHTPLSDQQDGSQTNTMKPVGYESEELLQTTGKEGAMFPFLIYNVVRQSIIEQRIKPTVRPAHQIVSEGLKEGLRDETGKHRHYTKPETQEITTFILERLCQEKIILENEQGGVGRPKYLLNKEKVKLI